MDLPLTDANISDDDGVIELRGGLMLDQNAAALQRLYNPKLSQSRFTGEALLAPDTKRLRPKEAMQFWTTKQSKPQTTVAPALTNDKTAALKAAFDPSLGARAFWGRLEQSSARQRTALAKDRKQPWITWKQATAWYSANGGLPKTAGVAERQQNLDADKKQALDEVYYGKFQGGIGQEVLWHALQSLPRQQKALEENGRGWISYRDMAAYYQTQETAQLMRNAPALSNTRTKVPREQDMLPLRKLQADTISMKGMPSGGFHGVINIIDLFSHYTWQVPVQTVGSSSNSAAAVNALVNHIDGRYALPAQVTLHTDNGPEFGHQFEARLDPRIGVTHGPAYTSNSQGEVENANKIWRGVMRRLLHSKSAKPADWSKHMVRANEIMNSRPNQSIDWKSSSQVLHGTLAGDDELLQGTRKAILKRANARRGPSTVTAYKIGDRVRVINQKYLSDKLRSNLSKTNPRWSKTIFRIRTVKGAESDTMQPEYILECTQDPCPPAAKRLLKPPQGESNRWFPHDHLLRIEGTVVKAPSAVVNADHTPDADAQPFASNPSIATPRRSQREVHELEGKSISVQWIFDDSDELRPATELNVQAFGDDDAVWYDAVVRKVRKDDVEVFYPADDAVKRHNLLVSGVTPRSPEPLENYMPQGTRWKLKD